MESAYKSLDGQIERILAFLNSRGVGFETGKDTLSSVADATTFFDSTFGAAQVLPRNLGELKRLRQALLDLVVSGWEDDAATKALNEISLRSPYTLAFRDGLHAHLEPLTSGSAIGLVLRDVAVLIEAGQFGRIKNCWDEACSSTFFDRSRNKSQRWHSFDICGNKHNVAAHRERRA